MRKISLVCFGLFLLLTIAGEVRGGGFQNPVQGASASAQAGAFVAQADDATAITHNPAGLTQLSGTVVLFTPTIIAPSTKYQPEAGPSVKMKEEVHFLPNLYFATDLGKADWRFGIALATLFGQSTDWPNDSPFSNFVTRSEMIMFDINPTVACRVNPNLSLAAGLNYYSSKISMEALTLGGGEWKVDGDGEGWGYNLGLLYKPSEKHSFGGTFRSGIEVKHRGGFLRNQSKFQHAGFGNDRVPGVG